jgi:hypothetical protein
MNAKMNNMLEAAMPAPPPLTSFLKVLLEEGTPADTKDEADADPNFGDLYGKEQNLPQNTARMEACVRGLVRDFNAVCLKRGTTYPNLDGFFDGLAKFYIEGSLQFEDPVKQLLFEEMREKLIRNTPLLRVFLFLAKDAGVELRTLQASTCRTYVNATATAYRMAGKGRFVPSDEANFPRYNVFMNQCLKRCVRLSFNLFDNCFSIPQAIQKGIDHQNGTINGGPTHFARF